MRRRLLADRSHPMSTSPAAVAAGSDATPQKGWSFAAKLVLVLLCAQNAAHAIVARYSRGVLRETYNMASTVLVSEVLKTVTCMCVIATGSAGTSGERFLPLLTSGFLMLIPAAIYYVQNLLNFYALQNLEPATVVVLQQLKILTTGVFTGAVPRRARALCDAQRPSAVQCSSCAACSARASGAR